MNPLDHSAAAIIVTALAAAQVRLSLHPAYKCTLAGTARPLLKGGPACRNPNYFAWRLDAYLP